MNQEQLNNLRHSCAHLLAAAVMELWPNAKRAIGPAIEEGFYFDFDFGEQHISETDFPAIEKKMREIVKTWKQFERRDLSPEEAKQAFPGNQYKHELIDEFSKENPMVSFYHSGDYSDLCKGGHAENPADTLRYFKLLSIAGAYWRGNEKNPMLTRIYGTCFPTQKELEQYVQRLEEAKKRDHRKLGKELDLFVFSELVGSGLPLFTPRGTVMREELLRFSENLQQQHGFQKVWIPHITKTELYKRSGHWDKFGDELFLVSSQETDDQFVLKPMNCPHHIQLYASRGRSYRELPLRFMESTVQYRDEKAGELLGLSRVRAITIDDAHIFCRMDQIEHEFRQIMEMIKSMYGVLGMEFKARLSFRDPKQPKKYLGEDANWEKAQSIIENLAKKLELNYVVAEGEAAFYGPKIDILVIDSLGREWQCATEQLDFVQPARFGLIYTDKNGFEQMPVMIHKALLGSVERFLSVFIEHTAGNFPVWLSPVQVQIIAVGESHREYCHERAQMLREAGIRVEVDDADETVGKKIRNATKMKVPYMVVIGDTEMNSTQLSVRKRGEQEAVSMDTAAFVAHLQNIIAERSLSL